MKASSGQSQCQHLFNNNLPSTNTFNAPPPVFTAYPSALGSFVINDLDSSKQTWKIVVYHQPAFTSGYATIVHNQMRAIAKLLEDHGVNMVFNGHDHNYQRSLPIRATARTAGPVSFRRRGRSSPVRHGHQRQAAE